MRESGASEPPSLVMGRRLGQHFLSSENVAAEIAEALGRLRGLAVVEIGPGRGILTAALLARGARVLGIELDDSLVVHLRERFAGQSFDVVQGDVLGIEISRLAGERGLDLPLAVAGNIPYGITSPLLRWLLRRPGECGSAVLMVQREVAKRLLASPGTRAFGSLTVGVRSVAAVREVLSVPPGSFRPAPRVWSTVVRLDPFPDGGGLDAADRAALERLTKTLFSARRKQLQKILRTTGLVPAGDLRIVEGAIDRPLTCRPEELPVESFPRLLRLLQSMAREAA